MKTTVLIVTLLVSTTAIFAQQFKETDAVTALKLVKEGAVFIDVREKDEAATTAYGIDGVRNIPLNELETRMNEVPTTGTVILACNSGYRSGEAAKLLMANGRKDVYSLKGGILQWQRDGQPVVRKEQKTAKACVPGSKTACVPNADGTPCCADGSKKGKKQKNKQQCCAEGAAATPGCCEKK